LPRRSVSRKSRIVFLFICLWFVILSEAKDLLDAR
jgi:hypothetical protein